MTPTHNLFLNMCKAFLTGGAICTVGQFLLGWCRELGMDAETASAWCSVLLVLLSVVLTGLNLYPKLAKFGGRGYPGSHHRLRQFRGGPRHRIQKRGSGIRNRLQDFTIAGRDSLRDFHQLDAWAPLLGFAYSGESSIKKKQDIKVGAGI